MNQFWQKVPGPSHTLKRNHLMGNRVIPSNSGIQVIHYESQAPRMYNPHYFLFV
jgi:hypothetical protein